MRKVLLFSAVATVAFFVTLEAPVRPEVGFHVDFEPAGPAVQVSLSAQTAPFGDTRTL
jgi:hypothetical protein